VLELYYIYIIT